MQVGVDGCPAGWVAVVSQGGAAEAQCSVFPTFADLIDAMPEDAIIAVDMPIGLPERVGHGGRGPESLIRPHLGAAVYAEPGPFADEPARIAAHRRASEIAKATSDPSRGCSIQAFGLFAKVREIDTILRERPVLRSRVIESHPELAFWQLNGGQAMSLPKKIKGAVNPDGIAERAALLMRYGFEREFLESRLASRVGRDDFIDACAMMLVAARYGRGETMSFPDPPLRDAFGIEVAIRV
jgi:predicted RNase H-like nuclease